MEFLSELQSEIMFSFLQVKSCPPSFYNFAQKVIQRFAPTLRIPTKLTTFAQLARLAQKITETPQPTIIIGSGLKHEHLCEGDDENEISAQKTDIPSMPLFHCAVTRPAFSLSKDLYPTLSSDVILFRALTPNPSPIALAYKDRVDVFPPLGVEIRKEEEHLRILFSRATDEAINETNRRHLSHVTLVLKKLTRFKNLNAIFTSVVQSKFATCCPNLTVDLASTSEIMNRLVVFPERLGLILLNDLSSSTITEKLLLGLCGGTNSGVTEYHSPSMTVFNGGNEKTDNPVGILLAVGAALRALGYTKNAEELRRKIEEAVVDINTRPKHWVGGKLDAVDFVSFLCRT